MSMISIDGTEFEVRLPAPLCHLGETTKAIVTGDTDRPLIAVLGGISGNRFVCQGKEGGNGWWPGLVGPGYAIDPHAYRILGLDFAADATGRTAPSTLDQAEVLDAALDAMGAARVDAIVGASYGGMVALSFAAHFPGRVGKLAIISAGAEPHPAATGARDLQRRVVALGLANGNASDALSIARGMAMLTYRTAEEFSQRFVGGLPDERPLGPSAPGAYLHSRGQAFLEAMSPQRFLSLSGSIDRHCVDPTKIATPTILIGAETDQLVPPVQMRQLHAALAGPKSLHLLDCVYGHDMFLKEAANVGCLIKPFLET